MEVTQEANRRSEPRSQYFAAAASSLAANRRHPKTGLYDLLDLELLEEVLSKQAKLELGN